MIVKDNIEIGGRDFVKQYSDGGFYIERDGAKYSEAIDPADIPREYTETDEAIDSGEEPTVDDALDSGEEPTVDDALGMLAEMGVDVHD